MDSKAMDTLKSLMQLDVDAVHAYTQAIDSIEHRAVGDQLITFRGDHERHINELAACIRRFGGTPPERSRDFKGFLIEGFTAIRSMTGTEGALKAMKSNEETTNKQYGDAMMIDFPADVRALIERNFDDEKRHLAYVEHALADHPWERAA